jgi:hypothetical protein
MVESLQGWLVFKEAFQPYLLRRCLFGAPIENFFFLKGSFRGDKLHERIDVDLKRGVHVM